MYLIYNLFLWKNWQNYFLSIILELHSKVLFVSLNFIHHLQIFVCPDNVCNISYGNIFIKDRCSVKSNYIIFCRYFLNAIWENKQHRQKQNFKKMPDFFILLWKINITKFLCLFHLWINTIWWKIHCCFTNDFESQIKMISIILFSTIKIYIHKSFSITLKLMVRSKIHE